MFCSWTGTENGNSHWENVTLQHAGRTFAAVTEGAEGYPIPMPGSAGSVRASTMIRPACDLGMRTHRIAGALHICADKKISLIQAGSQQRGPDAVTFPAWSVSDFPGQAS